MSVSEIDTASIRRHLEGVEAVNKAFQRSVEQAFYANVRAYRACGIVEPHTYHKALEALNNAVKPFNEAYKA
jgi:hypothetical protein